jgi:dihydroorotase
VNAAATLHREDELGTLAPGRPAEVSVLRVEFGEFAMSDGFETIPVPRRLSPVGCLRAGRWIDALPELASPASPQIAAVGAGRRTPPVAHVGADGGPRTTMPTPPAS